MRITALLLFISFSAFSQSVQITVSNIHPDSVKLTVIPPKPKEKVYVQPPKAPVFSNQNTITLSGNQTIFASNLNGKLEQILTGTATNLTLNGIGGTASMPVIFSGGTIKGTSATQRSIRTLNATSFFELHGTRLTGNDGGVMLSAGANPAGVSLYGVEIIDPLFAGYWCNSAGNYQHINSYYLRIKNSGGEGIYEGSTSKSARSRIQKSKHEHLLIENAGWDGIQITSVNDLHINKFTVIGAGLKNVTGQNTLMQIQLCNGLIENGIMVGGVSSLSLFAHGLTLRNGYASWTNEDPVYIGEATGEPQLNGQPLIIDGYTFNVPGSKPLFTVAMRGADVIVKNCVISDNRKGLFTDARASGATNKLIDGGGNKFVPASEIPVPKFNPDGTVADDFYYNKGFGFGTP